MGEPEQQDAASSAKANAELAKLNLELGILKRQNPSVENFVKIVPVVTTLIAVLGLGFTIWQALEAQKAERIGKVQSQIRADKEQILEFITNDKTSSVRVAFLIDDLKSLVSQLSDSESETKVITEQLMRVAWELPFSLRRDFDFDVSALRGWTDFRQFWQTYPGSHHLFLTNKYYPRFVQLHAEGAACMEKLDYGPGTHSLTYQNAGMPCQEALINALMNGYESHLKIMKEKGQTDLIPIEIEEFRKSTNNSVLAGELSAFYLYSQQ